MALKKRILQMSQEELRAVVAIVVPGRKADVLKTGEMQEICIKWLFGNGLSINHIFELQTDEATGQIYCVMRNSEPCWCCPKACESATLFGFDRGPIGNDFQRAKTDFQRPPSPPLPPPYPLPPPKKKNESGRKPPSPEVAPTAKSGSKIAPITVQPTYIDIDPDRDKKEKLEKEDKTTCGYCKRECGYCIVQLCSQV